MTSSRVLRVPADLVSQVDDAEYARLLGYPHRRLPAGAVSQRAAESRSWYARNGRPWAFARTVALDAIFDNEIELADGTLLTSTILAQRLREAAATAVVAAAVSAGFEVDERTTALWREDRPDEAYLLDRFGAVIAESLAAWTGRYLRETAGGDGLAALPGYSPGYDGWALEDQVLVARCLTAGGTRRPPGVFEVLDSGMIEPRNSLLAVFGLAPRTEATASAWRASPCSWCSSSGCGYRRSGAKEIQA